jgi:sugar (pentulose or hexulose) kinase
MGKHLHQYLAPFEEVCMVNGDLVLGIDAGTGSLRAGLFNLQGQPLGFAERSYVTHYPNPGWAEQHPASWWDALVGVVLQKRGRKKLNVSGPSSIFLDNHSKECVWIFPHRQRARASTS